MAMIVWDDSYSVSVGVIDYQHQRLLEIINLFYEGIKVNEPKEKLLNLILKLREYSLYHFATEEKYMVKFAYEGYEQHKQEHQNFIDSVLSFETKYKNDRLLISIEVTNFIKEWIINHIKVTDKDFSELFVANGLQ